jgi:hypothetical protein
MPSTQTPVSEADRSTPSAVHPLVEAVRAHLLALKQPVDAEIRAYPPPIPACDAQFNHLLDTRAGLSRALVRLDEIAKQDVTRADEARALDAFIESCDYIDDAAAEEIRARTA